MAEVLQELFAVGFILLQHFNLGLPLFGPGFYVGPHFINTFLREDILIVKFFFPACLGLVDELIDEFDLPVDEGLNGIEDEAE